MQCFILLPFKAEHPIFLYYCTILPLQNQLLRENPLVSVKLLVL